MVPEERHHKGLAVAGACVALGIAIVALALFALPRGGSDAATLPPTPPPTTVVAASSAAPVHGQDAGNSKTARRKASAHAAAAGGTDAALERARSAWEEAFVRNEIAHVPAGWVAGYYDLYARAQETFGVNWLLLASVHRQETGLLDGVKHLPRAQLRSLLRWSDAVQRHQRPDDDLGALSRAPTALADRPRTTPTAPSATRRCTTTSTR